MTKDRKFTTIYLMDIKYKYSMNYFEECYGDSIPYSFIEQESYIDLKKMISDLISDKIKFRKHERNNNVLTLKVEMLNEEKDMLTNLINENKLNFLHDYEVNNIRTFLNN